MDCPSLWGGLERPGAVSHGHRRAVLPSPDGHRDRARAGKAGSYGGRSRRRLKRQEAEVRALSRAAPVEVSLQIGENVIDVLGLGFACKRHQCCMWLLSFHGCSLRAHDRAAHQPFGRSFLPVQIWIRSCSRANSVAPARVFTAIFPYSMMTWVCTLD